MTDHTSVPRGTPPQRPGGHTSVAVVRTETPDRFAKQLVSHLGRRLEIAEEDAGARVVFPGGDCLLLRGEGQLELRAYAVDPETLTRVRDVVGRHLEKFGARAGLVVEWT